MVKPTCPSCGEDVVIPGRPELGQRVVCPSCDSELEVIELEPLELDWPFDEDEDWDDDWDDDWDEEDEDY
jgi:alpha-aminoadipate carrier protein LysW